MTTTNFATSGERASKLAGRSINRERDKPECYRKLRSRSASPTFSTPPKVVVVLPRNFASQPMSSSPSPLRLSPPGPLRLRIKPTWLSARCRTTIISLVWFFFTVDVFLSLSLSRFPPFLKSLDENERPRRRSSLPPSLPPSANPKGARREGKDGGIYVRNGKYSCESSYICQQTFHATVALIFDPLKNAPGEEWDDYHRGKGRNFKVNIELRRGQNDYDETWNVSEGRR